MKKKLTLTVMVLFAISNSKINAQETTMQYPETHKGDVTDTYFGTEVADPYRWLEDDRSADPGPRVRDLGEQHKPEQACPHQFHEVERQHHGGLGQGKRRCDAELDDAAKGADHTQPQPLLRRRPRPYEQRRNEAEQADEQRQVAAHMRAILLDETLQAAEMIPVAVAQDEAVQARGIDAQQVEIAVEDLRGVAEIKQVLRPIVGAFRFQVQRKAPLRRQGRHLPARDPLPAP